MKCKYNINVIMCEHADESVTHINNIFNRIKLDKEGKASFDVVTFVNSIGKATGFVLIYILRHKEEAKAFLTAVEYTYDSDGSEEDEIECASKTDINHFDNINFVGAGDYFLELYQYEQKELENAGIDYDEDFEQWVQKLSVDKVACVYDFTVV